MTEEINYSYDGGIYGELVRDRTIGRGFGSLKHWPMVARGNCPGECLRRRNHRAQRRTHAQPPRHRDEGRQRRSGRSRERWLLGHPCASALQRYSGSFYAKIRHTGSAPSPSALQNDQTGVAAATATVTGLTSDWKRYTYTLKTGDVPASSNNHLILTIRAAGHRVVRSRLALPAHLPRSRRRQSHPTSWICSPPCIRTSCACPAAIILRASAFADRFDWKKTIGPWADRPDAP